MTALLLKWVLGKLLDPKVLMYALGAIALTGGLTWAYLHVYNKGVAHERAAWEQKVEEAAAKREAERAAAQREQDRLAAEQIALETELALEKQEHSDDLARALAANSASNAPLGVVPDGVLAPFRAIGARRKAQAGGH